MVLMLRFWSRLEGLYQIRWSQVDLDLKEKECNVRKGFKGKIICCEWLMVQHNIYTFECPLTTQYNIYILCCTISHSQPATL